MWVSVALETDAAHADSLSDALMAAGAISVSVEDADAGTDAETPQFGEPGRRRMPARPCGTTAGSSRCSTRRPT
jgi:ribosomal protein L11 methyltransferase